MYEEIRLPPTLPFYPERNAEPEVPIGRGSFDRNELRIHLGKHIIAADKEVDPRRAEVKRETERLESAVNERIADRRGEPVDRTIIDRSGQFGIDFRCWKAGRSRPGSALRNTRRPR